MKHRDLFAMCFQNLFRHRARTMLTVLGVVVGCCSIIIMVSIGIGMKESQEKMLSEMGDLSIITVMPTGKGGTSAKLNEAAMKSIRQLPSVEAASPKLTAEGLSLRVFAGNGRRYVNEYTTIVGLDPDALEKLGYNLTEGTMPGKKSFNVLIGQNFAYSFQDTKRPPGRNMIDAWADEGGNMPDPYFNAMKEPLNLEVDIEGGSDNKKFSQLLTVTGKMKEDYGKGYETSDGIIMSIQDLNKLMDQQRRASGKAAKKDKDFSTALVKVRSIQDVETVENAIKEMGFRTSSMESIRKPMEKEAQQKQMMLGGLGAISLLVAALGIANTMMMSITERTREIGIMKSLGCYVNDVRTVFLLEAGGIGLLGGIIGIVISVIISVAMNLFSNQVPLDSLDAVLAQLVNKGSRMSVIPPWLFLFSLAFSIFIGVGSGYYPANKAVQISALEAIKHD